MVPVAEPDAHAQQGQPPHCEVAPHACAEHRDPRGGQGWPACLRKGEIYYQIQNRDRFTQTNRRLGDLDSPIPPLLTGVSAINTQTNKRLEDLDS